MQLSWNMRYMTFTLRMHVPIFRPDYISPLDDLAFDMYQDPQVASIIRKLDKRKAQAISGWFTLLI